MNEVNKFDSAHSPFETEEMHNIFNGSTIINSFISEGGLTIVFEKNSIRGFFILGYTELGEWIEHFQYGNDVVTSRRQHDEKESFTISKIIFEYGIEE